MGNSTLPDGYQPFIMRNSGKRNLPLNDALQTALRNVLPNHGVTAIVTSGGQVTAEEAAQGLVQRTGSTRHDHGGAADVKFRAADGRTLSWANKDDIPVLQGIVRDLKSAGLTGFGAAEDYMGHETTHIGFGNPAVWGAKGGKPYQALVDAFNGPAAGSGVANTGTGPFDLVTSQSLPESPPPPVEALRPPSVSSAFSAVSSLFSSEASDKPPGNDIAVQPADVPFGVTDEDIAQAKAAEHKLGYRGFSWEGVQESLGQSSVTPLDFLFQPTFTPEYGGDPVPLTQQRFEEDRISRFPLAVQQSIAGSQSWEEYRFRMVHAEMQEASQRRLMASDYPISTALVGGLLDPATLVVGLGEGAILGALLKGASRTTRVLAGAGLSGTTGLGMQAAAVSQNPFLGEESIYYSGAASVALSLTFGAFGSLLGNFTTAHRESVAKAAGKAVENVERSVLFGEVIDPDIQAPRTIRFRDGMPIIDADDIPVGPSGGPGAAAREGLYGGQTAPADAPGGSAGAASREGLDGGTPAASGAPGGSAGAMAADPLAGYRSPAFNWEHFSAAEEAAGSTPFARFRYDMASRGKNSPNPGVSALSGVLVSDPVGYTNKARTAAHSTEDIRAWRRGLAETSWRQAIDGYFAEYAKSIGKSADNTLYDSFKTMTRRAVEETDPRVRAAYPAQVLAAADNIASWMDNWLGDLQDPGRILGRSGEFNPVAGADMVPANRHYMPHIVNPEKFNNFVAKHGMPTAIQVLMRAMPAELDDALKHKIARGWARTVMDVRVDTDLFKLGEVLRPEHIHQLREILQDGTGATAEEIEEVVARVIGDKVDHADDGRTPRLKRRTRLFGNAETQVTDPDTGQVSMASIFDFMEDDLDVISTIYTNSMAGRVALAVTEVPGWFKGLPSDAAIEKVLRDVRDFESNGTSLVRPPGSRSFDQDDEMLKFMFDRLRGFADPRHVGPLAAAGRVARDFNYLRVGGTMGFAQLGDIGTTLAEAGLSASLRHLPVLAGFARRGRNGKFNGSDQEMLRDIDAFVSLGTNGVRMKRYVAHSTDPESSAYGRAYEKLSNAEKALGKGRWWMSKINGMNFVVDRLQRFAAASITQKLFDLSKSGKAASRSLQDRLRNAGMSPEMSERVAAQMRKHGKWQDGLLGGKIITTNYEKWDDLEARAAANLTIFKMSRRMASEPTIGGSAQVMSHPAFQLITQFRSFSLHAHTNNLLRGLHHRDWVTAMNWFWGLTLGAISYIGLTYIQASGRSDRDEFLERRLSPSMLAKAAFQRSGASALVPTAIDTPWVLTGGDPVFDARTSTQATDVIFGNPTVGGLTAFEGFSSGMRDVAGGKPLSQKVVRQGLNLIPFQNLLPITAATNALISGLPEGKPRR